MTEAAQTALAHLERLTARGRRIGAALREDPTGAGLAEMRAWQNDVAVAVNELSGGSKAHWLSKAFSGAFLISTPADGDRELVVEAPAGEIVDRLLAVIAQAHVSLMQVAAGTGSMEPNVAPRRFEFVHHSALRPVLEEAYAEAERALDTGEPDRAFVTFCGLLESIITDALAAQSDGRSISEMSFAERIAAAETSGLIHSSCARLPPSARQYRERAGDAPPASMRDANVARQVLRVVMRDLDPGR